MSASLQHELKQSRPFPTLEEEALLSIQRTAAVLGRALGDVLKPYELSAAQYNVLRILRGAGEPGLCRYEVGDRLVTPVPDVTRLIDRLEARGLVARTRDEVDRRQSRARITDEGLRLLEQLDTEIQQRQKAVLGHVQAEDLRRLIDLLAAARTGI
ncbi:MAG TPA: MarR family transcriptional regulator [Planctomycetota bacterium]|nr:MarR family transcriptional regulator [Planctomycetota bacterium]